MQNAWMFTIRPALADDEAQWRALWRGYCAFYSADVSEDVTAHTWGRIVDPSSSINCIFAEQDGHIVGFANYVVHDNTWDIQPLCYLEDLFVAPEVRGSGAGKALIQWLKDGMATYGWARLYWVTHKDNAAARRLYDQFVSADDFVRYVIRH
jgi:GNAT superfamily N-acetyltransferase